MHLSIVAHVVNKPPVTGRKPARLHIQGPSQIQNALLARHLEEHLQTPVTVSTGRDPAPDGGVITLRDCVGFGQARLDETIRRWAAGEKRHGKQILFNLSPQIWIEQQAIEAGFSGIFYNSDNLDVVLRGIRTVLDGDLWFSRQTSSRSVVDLCLRLTRLHHESAAILSHREGEVLGLLVRGASNAEISDALCISPATVKTHLYKVYKKLGFRNRSQAAQWAARCL